MNAFKINTNEELMEHIKTYLICTDMSEHVKNFGWCLYWVGLAIIAKEKKATISEK